LHCTFAADFEKIILYTAMAAFRKYSILLIFSWLTVFAFGQEGKEQTAQHPTDAKEVSAEGPKAEHNPCGEAKGEHESEFNAGDNAVEHIADANAIHVFGDTWVPLPVILYAPAIGWTFTSSGSFKAEHHGTGTVVRDGYVLIDGTVMRVKDPAFPRGEVAITGEPTSEKVTVNGKDKEIFHVFAGGACQTLDTKTTFDGGLMGGGITSFYDFSITKNVFTMLLTVFFLFFVFRSVALSATRTHGHAPKGLQNFIEPLYVFVRDEVAKANIGPKYERYMPYLMSAFFFILGLNLIGQIPFFPGGANVTGNISITLVLAVITFITVNVSGNKNYWEHIVWMPGVPAILKILLITPIEILSLFLKPFTLLLRLFANISAGHIVILSFVSLIFILGKAGQSVGGSVGGMIMAVPLTLFMSALELLVAFLQAYIFVMLSAVYIGAAVEEHHH
jgi:F-type H+-transporting ATPase subunit a